MIIGISGKIGSGKDTIGNIIRTLTAVKKDGFHPESDWKIKKFAYKLKQIVSILTGIPVEDLEKQEVKDSSLGKDWIRYAYAHGFTKDHNGETTMLTTDCDEERYIQELKTNWQTAYKVEYTVRLLLQRVGTEAMRNQIHPNIWVNALFADYKNLNSNFDLQEGDNVPVTLSENYPNWIITDVRFPNEAQAIKERGGILIRVNRPNTNASQHPSETSLDNYEGWSYIIDNSGTLDQLVEMVSMILKNEKII